MDKRNPGASLPYIPPTPSPLLQESPYAVKCWTCGTQELTRDQYNEQMDRPDARWCCPKCGRPSEFDDARYELWQEENDEAVEIAAKLAAQFPKVHFHAAGWKGKDESTVFTSIEDYRARTTKYETEDDAWCRMEHRHCACGSTLMVVTAIHDLAGYERVGAP